MSHCPNCQHNLSQVELQSGECPACGHSWQNPPAQGADAPKARPPVLGGFASESLPQAISGIGKHGTGLSSASEPETWDVDSDGVTHDASDLMEGPGSGPLPLELDPEDLIRMSKIWGAVDDEVPSGMTIKSQEVDLDEVEENRTVDVAELQNAEDLEEAFRADESSKTFSPGSEEPDAQGLSSVGDTFVSDEPSPDSTPAPSDQGQSSQDSVSDTYLSDNFPPDEKPESEFGPIESVERRDTPAESAGTSSYDQTFVAPDSVSGQHDSQDLADEHAKTLPLSGEGDWIQTEGSKTFAGPGPKTTEDEPSLLSARAGDTDKTLISSDLSGENYTDSGSAEGARRTDPLASDEILGTDAAEGTGLVIQPRLLKPQDETESDKADYQILSLLGEGGMGQVFNARQTSIDRVVAVKMLKSRASSRKRDQHVKFLAEAVVTGELDHPNIVPIYDVGRDQNNALFYSMKNVTGNPWLDTIHQKTVHDNLEILMSVADAVAFAHARGVVHRDLKPENVMLGEFGEVLLMDWGLAMPTDKFRKQRGIVRSSSMGGTPAYMAPEMATGPITKIGPHSDIYLLGAILFETITGRPPHRGKNAMKCLMSAARNKIVQTEHSGELIEIAYKAMSTDPKDRYKSVQEFQAAVRTYLAHSESITLAAVAEEDLERAQKTDSYEDYAKARFGFEEALKLWDGNKRARSSLAAARLAYAHCAMGRGDYDLATSLLDSAEKTHEKLKVDIAKARDERDARQKRLEAARRAGRVMLATLFLVVTGAAFWINNERANAVASEKAAILARDDADEARKKEEGLRIAAEDAKKAVEDALKREEDAREREAEQRRIAVRRQREAKAQQVVASINAILAEEQKQIAEEQRKKTEEALEQVQIARDREAAERQQAQAQRIIAGISAISAEEQAQLAQEQEANAKHQEALAKEQEGKAIDAANAAEDAREVAEERRQQAEAQQIVASLNAIMAEEQQQLAEEQRQLAEQARTAAEIAQKKAEEAKLKEEQEAYISKVGLAAAKIEANAFDAAEDLLENTNPVFRNWEWGYLMHLCKMSKDNYPASHRLEAAALIGDGKEFVIAGYEGLVEIRSVDQPDDAEAVRDLSLPGKSTVFDLAVSPNGRYIALGTDDLKEGFIKIWDRQQQKWIAARFGSPDVSYRNPAEYMEKLESRHMEAVVSVEFSQDGTKLLTSSQDSTARVWDVTNGRQLTRLFGTSTVGLNGYVWDATFCPNFETDADGNLIRDENGQLKPIPETKIITACEDGNVMVWVDAGGGQWRDPSKISPLPAFRGHDCPIYSVDCSPDGQYVVSGGFDHRILLWRLEDIPQISQRRLYELQVKGEPVPQTPYRELVGHNGPIRSVQFGKPAPGDTRSLVLLTSSDDNTVRVWNVDRETSQDKISPIKTFRGHGGYVRDSIFNPAGTWILSVSHDRTAKRWSLDEDAKTEVYLVNGSPLDGHEDTVDAVAFSFSNGKKAVATASRDKKARIYSLVDENHLKQQVVIAEGHDNLIPAGVYFDGGKQLATAGFDNTARIWDVLTGTEKLMLEGTGFAGVIAVSPRGRWILTGSNNASEYETDAKKRLPWKAKLWDARSPEQPVLTFGNHPYEVTSVAFANNIDENGELLFATADAGGTASLWRWTPGEKAPIEQKLIRFKGRLAHNDRIVGLRFLPNDEGLISASYDHAVSQWNAKTGQPVPGWDLTHPQRVSAMDMTADGRWLVTTCFDNIVRVWDVETSQILRELRPEGRVFTLLSNVAAQLETKRPSGDSLERAWKVINPDLKYEDFIQRGGWQQGVEILRSHVPRELDMNKPPRALARELAALFDGVTADQLLLPKTDSVAISPDGSYLVVANRIDRMAHGWQLPEELTANTEVGTFEIGDGTEIWSVAFSPDTMRTDLVLLGFSDARQFQLNTNAAGLVVATPSVTLNSQGAVASAAFSPDGRFLVTGSRDRAARVWNVKTGRNMAKLQGVHTAPVNAAIWAARGIPGDPDGYYIVTVSDMTAKSDVSVALWKLIPDGPEKFRGELVRTFTGHTENVLDAAFSPDGKWVVTVSQDRTIRLWDTATGKEVAKTAPQADAVLCVAFADDGNRVLTGSASNQAVIWTVIATEAKVQFKPQLLLEGHSAKVTDVAFSPLEDLNKDGKISQNEQYGLRAVTASADNSVIVWDTRVPTYSEGVPSADQVLTLKRHNRPVKAVQFSPDGRYILTGSEDHRAILWPTKDWMDEKFTEFQQNPDLKIPGSENLVGSSKADAK